jgi:hypothetical protein
VAFLLVLGPPDELRVERLVARINHCLWGLLIVGDEVAQLFGRDVCPLVLVADRLDLGLGGRFLPCHQVFDSGGGGTKGSKFSSKSTVFSVAIALTMSSFTCS